jgi:hypothetical protein
MVQPSREARACPRLVANQLFACSAGGLGVCQFEQTGRLDTENLAPQRMRFAACGSASIPSGLTLKVAVRDLRAPVWTTMNSRKPVILVVEDEVLIRLMAVKVAEDSGFEALSAASADEAIGILESRSDVRLVFTDVKFAGVYDV